MFRLSEVDQPDMHHLQGRFKGVRNASISYQSWLPSGAVQAVLLVVHGLGEHCGRYMHVVDHFVPSGYAVYGFDHIGHGQSAGRREVVEHFTDYTDTLQLFYELVKGWQPGKPIFLLGHSMGGLILAYYLLDHQPDCHGAIFSAPAIRSSVGIPPALIMFTQLLAVFVPRLGVRNLVDVHALSRDPQVVAAYVNDPLVFHGKTSARLVAELLAAMRRVTTEAHRIRLPLIVLQGDADRLVDPQGAQIFYNHTSSRDKTLKIYPGLYHEVFNEPERGQVLQDVEAWLSARLAIVHTM